MANLNARQHRFVVNLFEGMSQCDAYMKAGYNCSDTIIAQKCASELVRIPEVSRQLAVLQEKRIARQEILDSSEIMSRAEALERLSTLARANLVDFLENGQPKLDKDTPNHGAAREYSPNKNIKLSDPIDAVRELSKMQGWYAPSKHLNANVTFDVSFDTKEGNDATEQREEPTENEGIQTP